VHRQAPRGGCLDRHACHVVGAQRLPVRKRLPICPASSLRRRRLAVSTKATPSRDYPRNQSPAASAASAPRRVPKSNCMPLASANLEVAHLLPGRPQRRAERILLQVHVKHVRGSSTFGTPFGQNSTHHSPSRSKHVLSQAIERLIKQRLPVRPACIAQRGDRFAAAHRLPPLTPLILPWISQ